ncbi:hypothetical protein [Fodinibius sp.]|uniref:hypothetical protein n=1 Tax=Fodinibius sp. TaxID=1872440 RepID=UPI002ACE3D5E|nr:hypothetical protein [Fodinibius sp.]MDZ7658646.1 hypothetical protein [Fodinibius sp.]
MTKKKKYYLFGFLALLIVIVGYHYIAASRAEQQIDETLQEYDEQEETLSIKYSSIDITPFSADVSISDLTIIFGDHIERSNQLTFDIGYWDFLNIYFFGAEYGLNQLDSAFITAVSPSYTNRSARQEIKSDAINISYRGNALDGLANAINGTPFQNKHSLEIESPNITFSLPNTFLTKVKTQQLRYTGSISDAQTNFWLEGKHNIQLDSLTWTPPESFQQKYNFFIKGFGYDSDSIPFDYAQLNTQPGTSADILILNANLKSDLALLTASGSLKIAQPLKDSPIHNVEVSLSDFSDRLKNVLSNIEQLLDTSLPKKDDQIILKLKGTISNPSIAQ